MEDRGLIKSQPTMIIRKSVKWHSHHGHQTRDMVQWTIEKIKEVLGIGGLITSRPAQFSLLPGEWHCDLSGHQASTMASIMKFNKHFLSINKGQWFQG